MALTPRRHQVLNNQTITASGNSGTLTNQSFSEDPTIVVVLDISGAVTNGGGNITFTVYGWTGSDRKSVLYTFTAQTAATAAPIRQTIAHALEENLEVDWVCTGSGYSYAGVNFDILMPSPAS